MNAKKCKHSEYSQIGRDYGFTQPVYREPYTCENRAAHGGIKYTVRCERCGATRDQLVNGRHVEVGPWSAAIRVQTTKDMEIVIVRDRYRVEKHEDGYYAIELRNALPSLCDRAIGPCVSAAQAEWLANHGTTMIGR